MKIKFNGEILYWRGPAPFFFIAVPENESADIKGISGLVTYGWGVVPVYVRIGEADFKTSLFPKDGRYLVPVKASIRKEQNLDLGDKVDVQLEIRL